jgi:type VI secretion system protein
MSGPSLYDMLLGHIDGHALDDYEDNELEILSVMANLKHILNTRAGALKHLPDYGLPDLTTVYRNMPASSQQLQAQITTTLLIYEPRIQSVEVAVVPTAAGMLVSYELVCRLRKHGLVRFGTHYEPDGRTSMSWKRAVPLQR